MSGGGNDLIISNIFISFGDGVLWFVKVLFILYAIFFMYSYIRLHYKKASILFLVVSTLLTTLSVSYFWEPFEAISIPFFTVGIVLSLTKGQKQSQHIIGVCMLMFLAFLFLIFDRALALHGLINVVLISLLILALSIKTISIRIPAILGMLSFDLYLVHNKVLMVLRDNTDYRSLLFFLLISIVVTCLFFIFRTKILKI